MYLVWRTKHSNHHSINSHSQRLKQDFHLSVSSYLFTNVQFYIQHLQRQENQRKSRVSQWWWWHSEVYLIHRIIPWRHRSHNMHTDSKSLLSCLQASQSMQFKQTKAKSKRTYFCYLTSLFRLVYIVDAYSTTGFKICTGSCLWGNRTCNRTSQQPHRTRYTNTDENISPCPGQIL